MMIIVKRENVDRHCQVVEFPAHRKPIAQNTQFWLNLAPLKIPHLALDVAVTLVTPELIMTSTVENCFDTPNIGTARRGGTRTASGFTDVVRLF
jgi:hypothetical protein